MYNISEEKVLQLIGTKYDVAFLGEGDITNIELLQMLKKCANFREHNWSEVKGVAYKDKDETIIYATHREVIKDIPILQIDYNFFEIENIFLT